MQGEDGKGDFQRPRANEGSEGREREGKGSLGEGKGTGRVRARGGWSTPSKPSSLGFRI